jgi:hypothetical protein
LVAKFYDSRCGGSALVSEASSRSGLVTFTIPANVTIIWDYAIAECHSLTSAYFKGEAPAAGLVFSDDLTAAAYHIAGTAYWTATFGWIPG